MESVESLTMDAQPGSPRAQSDLLSAVGSSVNPYQQRRLQDNSMKYQAYTPTQEFQVVKDADGELKMMARPEDDTSDDDGPIMARRNRPAPSPKRSGRSAPSSSGAHGLQLVVPTKTVVQQKKPGPRRWAPKPIKKNDMKAKKAVIHEIEALWGKGFIRKYIPKCHRPLVKRPKAGKRLMNRSHETDPKNWLPSVLKAILMIAKLTDNKDLLKQAMNDVVRFRIKNTGNRKPQLVTTDFDVIEDMLVKQWDVEYAFDIRYKHLLVHRKDQMETDEDIDHILQVGSDLDASSDLEDDQGQASDDSDDASDDQDGGMGQFGASVKYQHGSGHAKASSSQYPPPIPRQQSKQLKSGKSTPSKTLAVQPPPGFNHGFDGPRPGYGQHLGSWGHPMAGYGPQHGYGGPRGGYGPYGGYPGYAAPPVPHFGSKDSRQGSQQPSQYGMPHFQPQMHPMTPSPSGHESEYGGMRHFTPYRDHPGFEIQGSVQIPGGRATKIKREPSVFDERRLGLGLGEDVDVDVDDLDGPTNDLNPQDDKDNNDDGEEALIQAEVEAMDLELKIKKKKIRLAQLKQKAK